MLDKFNALLVLEYHPVNLFLFFIIMTTLMLLAYNFSIQINKYE